MQLWVSIELPLPSFIYFFNSVVFFHMRATFSIFTCNLTQSFPWLWSFPVCPSLKLDQNVPFVTENCWVTIHFSMHLCEQMQQMLRGADFRVNRGSKWVWEPGPKSHFGKTFLSYLNRISLPYFKTASMDRSNKTCLISLSTGIPHSRFLHACTCTHANTHTSSPVGSNLLNFFHN